MCRVQAASSLQVGTPCSRRRVTSAVGCVFPHRVQVGTLGGVLLEEQLHRHAPLIHRLSEPGRVHD